MDGHPSSGYAATWRRKDREGYWRRRWWEGPRETRKQHELLEHRWVWEATYGEVLPEGFVVHHWDEDRGNNEPSNLVALRRKLHDAWHGKVNRRRLTPDGQEKQCPRCERWLPIGEYYESKGKVMSYCPPCHSAYNREKRRT